MSELKITSEQDAMLPGGLGETLPQVEIETILQKSSVTATYFTSIEAPSNTIVLQKTSMVVECGERPLIMEVSNTHPIDSRETLIVSVSMSSTMVRYSLDDSILQTFELSENYARNRIYRAIIRYLETYEPEHIPDKTIRQNAIRLWRLLGSRNHADFIEEALKAFCMHPLPESGKGEIRKRASQGSVEV